LNILEKNIKLLRHKNNKNILKNTKRPFCLLVNYFITLPGKLILLK